MDIKVDYAQLPASPSLWPISRIPCPSHLFKKELIQTTSEKTGHFKTVDSHIYVYIYFLFCWVV